MELTVEPTILFIDGTAAIARDILVGKSIMYIARVFKDYEEQTTIDHIKDLIDTHPREILLSEIAKKVGNISSHYMSMLVPTRTFWTVTWTITSLDITKADIWTIPRLRDTLSRVI